MIPKSVTQRLVFFYCVLLVLLGSAFLLFTVVSFHNYARQTIATTLAARTQEIWNTSQGLLDQPQRLKETIERRFSPESQDRFIRIRIGRRAIYRSGEPIGHDFSSASVPLTYPDEDPRDHLRGNLLLYSANFSDSDAGIVTIDSGQSYQFARAVQSRLAASLLVGLPIMLLAAAWAGYILMRRALTPIETMINAAEAYTFNDPHSRLPLLGAEPRIEALGLALNRMLDRLDAAYAHVSRFSADAAHELRTPLTIIRGEMELIMSGAKLSSDVDRAVSNALEEMTRLSGIVDSLITLSRMESLWGKNAHSSIDMRMLAEETIDQLNLMAEEKNIRLAKPAGPHVTVAGDRDRLKQVLVNLLDNAIKYTPEGGIVSVQTGVSGDMATVTVEDSGIGIDPSHHANVFERFYRVHPDRGELGAGLGLAIVKSICHAHGGTVSLRSVPGIGSCFIVELPLLKADVTQRAGEPKVAAADAATATDSQNAG